MRTLSTFYIFLFLIIATTSHTQVSGFILDQSGEPLPGASVLLRNTTRGVTTNTTGYFHLVSTPDTFTLVISYVGSKTKYIQAKRNSRLRITLEEEVIEMAEVVIKSGENPAIPIIRKAIEKRKELADIRDRYRTTAYTKGVILSKNGYDRLKSLGAVDSTEVRDSAGNIIMYLAESLTEYTKIGNDTKEKILSSRRSGDTKGIALNFIRFFNVDFTGNFIPFQKNVVNPIGNAAFQYYNYELEGSYYEGLQKYYKIRVIPKRREEAVLFGNIYIADNYFTLKQVDLYTRGPNVGLELVDTLTIKQSFIRIDGFEKWMPLSQLMAFNAGFFGINFEGSFIGMYNDYQLLNGDEKIEDKQTIIEFDKLATRKSEVYWDSLRPLKLTEGELLDYKKRDSIALVHESPAYLDSMDRIANRFKPIHIFTRYTFRNSVRNYSLSAGNLIMGLRFDAVQGFSVRPDVTFNKYWKERFNNFRITARPIYGFSEKKLRYEGLISWQHRGVKAYRILLRNGNTADNYNTLEPITPLANEYSSLVFKNNYIRFYDNTYVSLEGLFRLSPGITIEGGLKAQHREGLLNHTNYSFRLKEKDYAFNYPDAWGTDDINSISNAYTTHVTFRWQPGNKIIQLPEEAFVVGSGKPVFEVASVNAWALEEGDARYDRINFNIKNINIPLAVFGKLSGNIHSGMFYGSRPEYRLDYAHFPGNLVYVKNTNTYLDAFKRISYYQYSTNDKYLTWFGEWNLGGYLFKKIPLLNKTGFEEVFAINGLVTPEAGTRIEISAGIDRIGIGSFRLFRFDYFWIFERGKYVTNNFVFGFNLDAVTGLISGRN